MRAHSETFSAHRFASSSAPTRVRPALSCSARRVIAGLDALEGRLEAAEMEQLALRGELGPAEERSEGLREQLEGERARAGPAGQRGREGPAWRRWLGGR